ncbi:MAG: reverse transcriptase family protein, partial [Oscillospiraceae bacterium]
IMESIISAELRDYLLHHNLITPQQHGFIKRHSTLTNLLESTNDWTLSLSKHKSVDICYIDFQKAFDSLSHPKLVQKLSAYGISGNLLAWISAFLLNRTQCVKVGSVISSSCSVSSGVPQGSVLGPLLFILYINDITDGFDSSVITQIFADDLKVYSEISAFSPSANLQDKLNIIHAWSLTWQLTISLTKCHILHLGSSPILSNYSISSCPISFSDQVKDLGIFVDRDLKFSTHINSTVAKAKQRGSLIFRSFISHDIQQLIRAFKVYVRPMVEYASPIWSPSYITQVSLIESVQRSFTKRLPGCSELSYYDRLSKLGLPSLEHRRLLIDLQTCYNIIHKNYCIDPLKFFTFSSNPSARGHSLRLTYPIAKTNSKKFFFSTRVVPVWNSLPENIVLSRTITSFKRSLSSIDFSKYLIFPSPFDT